MWETQICSKMIGQLVGCRASGPRWLVGYRSYESRDGAIRGGVGQGRVASA